MLSICITCLLTNLTLRTLTSDTECSFWLLQQVSPRAHMCILIAPLIKCIYLIMFHCCKISPRYASVNHNYAIIMIITIGGSSSALRVVQFPMTIIRITRTVFEKDRAYGHKSRFSSDIRGKILLV